MRTLLEGPRPDSPRRVFDTRTAVRFGSLTGEYEYLPGLRRFIAADVCMTKRGDFFLDLQETPADKPHFNRRHIQPLTPGEAAHVLALVVDDTGQSLTHSYGVERHDRLMRIAEDLDMNRGEGRRRPSHELLAEALAEWVDRRRG